MQAVLKPFKQTSGSITWWLLASIVIHLVLVFVLPTFSPPAPPPAPPELVLELVKKETPPAPPAVPTPPQPLPPTPPKKPPMRAPLVPIKPTPAPQPLTPPPTTEAPLVDNPKPVIAVKPSVSEVKPEVVVAPAPPPPEVEKPMGPSEGDIEAARNALRNGATRELKKNQRYPRIALDRGIEGVVKLKISLDGQGNITEVDILESSGNTALDDAAVVAAKKSSLKPYFNELLKGRIDSIVVPVGFSLVK